MYSQPVRLFKVGKEEVELQKKKRKRKRKRIEPVGACFLGGIPAEEGAWKADGSFRAIKSVLGPGQVRAPITRVGVALWMPTFSFTLVCAWRENRCSPVDLNSPICLNPELP